MPDWRKQAQERVNDKKEGSSLKLEEGTNCFRVMPDKKDLLPDGRLGPKGIQNPPYREFRMHRHVGPDDATIACGKDIDGKGRCWLCDEVIPKLEANPAKASQARNIGPQEQFVLQASRFDVDNQKFKLPKLMWVSTGAGIPGKPSGTSLALRVHSKIIGTRKDYLDPVKGYNLSIERTGTGLKTKYVSVEGDESPTKVPLSVTAAVISLDTLIPKYDEEDMKSAYFGRPRRDRNDDAPKRGGRSHDEDVVDDESSDIQDAEDVVEDDVVEDADEIEGDAPDVEDAVEDDAEIADESDITDAEPVDDEDTTPIDDDAPEEYSNDVEDEPPPPPTRRPAPAPAKKPAPQTAAPARRPAAPPPPPAKRPAGKPAPVPAKKPTRR